MEPADKIASLEKINNAAETTKISEFIAAFEKMQPLEETAKVMARIVKARSTRDRDKMQIINFYLAAKKWTEKNTPVLNDDDFANLSDEQLDALLKQYAPALVEIKEKANGKSPAITRNVPQAL